jgi:hypothetical protein
MTKQVGVTYDHRGMLVVAIEGTDDGVVVLLLQDDASFTKPLKAGLVFTVLEDSDFWARALPFASPEEQGKVPS